MFWNKKSNDEIELTPEIKEMVIAEIKRQQDEAERDHWLFVVGMASELFPGDNKAVEKIELAIKNVLTKIHGDEAMSDA